MSTQTGNATSYLDLLSKLRTFLTTDATLVGLGQNWTEVATNATPYTITEVSSVNTVDFESYLLAPGLSGTEAIYINIQAYHNVTGDFYNWRMKGAVGYVSSDTFFNQPGGGPSAFMLMWNTTIPYWFIANGQRVIVVAKIGTVYESCYLGKFLEYGTPGQYPYPLFIGGSCMDPQGTAGLPTNAGTANLRYSDTSAYHRAFFDPTYASFVNPDGSWQIAQNATTSSPNQPQPSIQNTNIWPYILNTDGGLGYTASSASSPLIEAPQLDGGYTVYPVRLEQGTPGRNLLGELHGVAFVTGFGNSSESDLTVGSDDYKVFQNSYLTGPGNFTALLWA